MTNEPNIAMYELAVSVRLTLEAHSLSNAGNNGSNRLFGRRQCLDDGRETDALSGNILKHHHASLTAEYMQDAGLPLCPACAVRDGRRAAALMEVPDYRDRSDAQIIRECALCNAHGYLIPAKKEDTAKGTSARPRRSNHSLIEFTFALALPEQHAETVQLFTRVGDSKDDGQMLMKMPARSGVYALCTRYKAIGVGMDTNRWQLVLADHAQRQLRHRAIMAGLRDLLVSPTGALTATMLPHLTDMCGVVMVRTRAGRAPLYSALKDDFMQVLLAMQDADCQALPFEGIDAFYHLMSRLMEASYPYLPATQPPAGSGTLEVTL